jgi:O-antigen/teichoic acid export membrane protein
MVRDSIVYVFGATTAAIIPVVLLPLLTTRLDPHEFGRVALFELAVSISAAILGFGGPALISVDAFRSDDATFRARFPSFLLLPCILGLASAAVADAIWVSSDVSSTDWELVALAPLAATCLVVVQCAGAALQARAEAWSFVVLQLSVIVVNLSVSIGMVLMWEPSAISRASGISLGYVAGCTCAWAMLRRRRLMESQPVPKIAAELARQAWPLIPYSVAALALTASDRLVISLLLGTAAVGTYAVAHQLASAVTLLHTGINLAWVPVLYSALASGDQQRERRVVRVGYGAAAVLLGATLLLILLTPTIFSAFIDPTYSESALLVPILAVAFLINGAYKLVANTLFFERRTDALAWLSVVNGLLAVCLAYGLTYFAGITGTAWANALTMSSLLVVAYVVAQRVRPLPWIAELPQLYRRKTHQ